MDVSSYLGGSFCTHLDLPAPIQVWTIGKVDAQLVGQGQTADQKICLTFNELPSKPLALNKTNLKRVAELYSTNGGAWAGRQLQVYRSTAVFQGNTVLCVRVCGPQAAPPEAICDQQGNAVLYQPPAAPAQQAQQYAAPQQPAPQPAAVPQPAVQQPAAAPQAAPAAVPQPQPVQAPVAAPQPQQPPAQPGNAAPWEANDNSPPAA
jgi:hypothetical protein